MHTSLILISAIFIMLASLSGAVFAWKTLGDWLTPRLRYLIALAAGVFVVIIYGLLTEVFHESGITYTTVLAFILGAVLLEGVIRLMPENTHHHHEVNCDHPHGFLDARRMMMVDAVHNIHDGLTLVPAFLVSPVVGFGTATGILLHEIVQEISEFFILKEAGYPARKALLWNFAVSSTILIGILFAMILVATERFSGPLIAFSAGGFLYVLFRDLGPSIISHAHAEKKYLQYGISFCIGFLLMLSVNLLVPHEFNYENVLPLPEGFGLARTPSLLLCYGTHSETVQ